MTEINVLIPNIAAFFSAALTLMTGFGLGDDSYARLPHILRCKDRHLNCGCRASLQQSFEDLPFQQAYKS